MIWLRYQIGVGLVILVLGLTGCLGQPGRTVDVVSTPEATPTPAVTPAPSPTPECWPLDPLFEESQEQTESLRDVDPTAPAVECPRGPAFTSFGAIQVFRHPILDETSPVLINYMIWREDTRTIYVIVKLKEDTGLSEVHVFPDTWGEDESTIHPDCEDMVALQDEMPPEDPAQYLQVPIRGFGKVWCENQFGDRIGFGVGWERGVDLTIQEAENGLYIAVPPEGEGGPQIFVLDTVKGTAIAL